MRFDFLEHPPRDNPAQRARQVPRDFRKLAMDISEGKKKGHVRDEWPFIW
jgi:hypothetical protein